MGRRCFVISPIGLEGSEVREHADDVYEFIIKPAMDECGVEAFRSDHLRAPGRISEQMFARILEDDFCIAVLTGSNPNCFYELAIAQAAGRPVIILQAKGETLPFDVQDLRCVYYDFKPRAIQEQVYVQELVAQIRSLEASGWTATSVIGASTRGQVSSAESPRYVARSAEFGNNDTWLDLLRDTEDRFDLMGISLGSWRTSAFGKTLADRTAAGCRVRILLLDAGNPALPMMINEAVETSLGVEAVRQQVTWMHEYLSKVASATEGVEIRTMRRGCPHFAVTLTDQTVVCIPYTYADSVSGSPLLEAKAGHPLYTSMDREFTALWEANR